MSSNFSVDTAIRAFSPDLPLAVGLSGGADSTALLLASTRKWPGQVCAIHVNHGLQSAARAFEDHCRVLCHQLSVPLCVQHVNASAGHGESPEDAARKARYKAFDFALSQMAQLPGWLPVRSIALAQHADDQVETVLLALSRGAGVAGLAGMPIRWQSDSAFNKHVIWHRPLLGVSGVDIRQWLRAEGVSWVEDPSNTNERFTRNRIRAQILPALEAAFPAFRTTFARSARHCAQANELLEEVAQQDLLLIGAPPVIRLLQQLSVPRQSNVLRHWLRQHHATTPSAAQMEALLRQISACTTRGHKLHLKVGRGFVVRQGEYLGWYNSKVLA